MNFKNMAVPVKQMLGYLVGILLLTILFAISIAHFSTIVSDYDHMMRKSWRQLDALQDLRARALQVRVDVDDNFARTSHDLKLMNFTFNRLMAGSGSGLPHDVVLIVKDMISFREETFKLVVMKEQAASAGSLADQEHVFNRAFQTFMSRIYVEIEKSKSYVAVQETRYLQRISYLLVLNTILAPLSFAFLYIYGFFLSNYTGMRLLRFLTQLKEILSGNYKARITDNSRDEIGQIATGVNELTSRLDR